MQVQYNTRPQVHILSENLKKIASLFVYLNIIKNTDEFNDYINNYAVIVDRYDNLTSYINDLIEKFVNAEGLLNDKGTHTKVNKLEFLKFLIKFYNIRHYNEEEDTYEDMVTDPERLLQIWSAKLYDFSRGNGNANDAKALRFAQNDDESYDYDLLVNRIGQICDSIKFTTNTTLRRISLGDFYSSVYIDAKARDIISNIEMVDPEPFTSVTPKKVVKTNINPNIDPNKLVVAGVSYSDIVKLDVVKSDNNNNIVNNNTVNINGEINITADETVNEPVNEPVNETPNKEADVPVNKSVKDTNKLKIDVTVTKQVIDPVSPILTPDGRPVLSGKKKKKRSDSQRSESQRSETQKSETQKNNDTAPKTILTRKPVESSVPETPVNTVNNNVPATNMVVNEHENHATFNQADIDQNAAMQRANDMPYDLMNNMHRISIGDFKRLIGETISFTNDDERKDILRTAIATALMSAKLSEKMYMANMHDGMSISPIPLGIPIGVFFYIGSLLGVDNRKTSEAVLDFMEKNCE